MRSRTARAAAAVSGSWARSQAQRVAVNEGTGTSPIRPPLGRTAERLAELTSLGAERVSFQRIAGAAAASVARHHPVLLARDRGGADLGRPAPRASGARLHQTRVGLARPRPSRSRVRRGRQPRPTRSGSTKSTLVPCVEQSTPATSGLILRNSLT